MREGAAGHTVVIHFTALTATSKPNGVRAHRDNSSSRATKGAAGPNMVAYFLARPAALTPMGSEVVKMVVTTKGRSGWA